MEVVGNSGQLHPQNQHSAACFLSRAYGCWRASNQQTLQERKSQDCIVTADY